MTTRSAPASSPTMTKTSDGTVTIDTPVASNGARAGAGPSEPAPKNTADQTSALPKVESLGGFSAILLGNLVLFISLGVILSVALYLFWTNGANPAPDVIGGLARWGIPERWWQEQRAAGWWAGWKAIVAPILGTLISLVLACLFALSCRKRTEAARVDPEIYGEIRARLETIEATLPAICPREGGATCDHGLTQACHGSCAEAWARRDFIRNELVSHGSRWVHGTGYVDLYRQLHAIEAALYLVQPSSEVVAGGLFDKLRLEGADEIPNWKALQAQIASGLALVGGPGKLTQSSTEAPIMLAGATPTPEEQALGRALLRDVRHAINEFRDSERASLVRARNQLAWTGIITAATGYMLLLLAMINQVDPVIVLTGVVYYIVGATVGLFNQLRTISNRRAGEHDFGFTRTRLFYTPVLSGLAAVGGVMVLALLYDAVDLGGAPTENRDLGTIFNVEDFTIGLVIAAVFGLTPDLLVNRLQHKADEYRTALTNTSVTANGTGSSG